MTQAHVIQATFLYEAMPPLPDERLRTELRALAARNNLPTAGETSYRDSVFRLCAEPYEIVVQPVEETLPAASFTGALSGHLHANLRQPLAAIVAEHTAHIQIAVRDTSATEEEPLPAARMRRLATFAQDVARQLLHLLPPLAVHWHPSNQLAHPAGLAASKERTLFLPMCLRLRSTSSVIEKSPQVNMAQAIEGSAALLGRPLHVMSTSLDRYETLDLAIAFIGQVVEGDGGPVAGTVFRDRKGTRVEVVEHKPNDALPAGLLALVELDQLPGPAPRPQVDLPRDAVAARVTAARASRPRDLDNDKRAERRASLTAAQAEVLRRSVARIEADENAAAARTVPTAQELRNLRTRTAGQARNTHGER